ncbi:SMP-30/gluconolactonase/LRE family protein [Frateuria defendens]|uniref:SMP-30/gluconolactonase/LRE family protein n=1 Tax=Frateuria defendens TaxID=2219559 RepID=UPI000A8EDB92|nr:SMP-30/gluconolactonase/LRE family protein [Frateuria defendens]
MSVTYDFKGQAALASGASSGMGLVVARAFAKVRAAVALACRSEADLHRAVDEITAAGGRTINVVCDSALGATRNCRRHALTAQFGLGLRDRLGIGRGWRVRRVLIMRRDALPRHQTLEVAAGRGGAPMGRIKTIVAVACVVAGACLATEASAQQRAVSAGLAYDAQTQGPVPIPPSERALQAVVASPWFKASEEGHVLEGAIFDHNGDLLFCDVTAHRVLRLTPDKRLSTVVALEGALAPGGLAFARDGRLFIAALDIPNDRGAIFAANPDGSGLRAIIPPAAGFMPNDLVFDARGGFYFTDFKGTATEPKGGVYYVAPDLSTIKPVMPHLAMANGVALSADGKTLWATEFGRNLLHRVELAGAATIAPIGSAIAYQFVGPAPDSMRTDADGNVYVAMYGQGRVMVLNRNGIPIGQVLLPGRERGHNLLTTSMAIDPASNDVYVVDSDGDGGQGATVFHAKVFSKGVPR